MWAAHNGQLEVVVKLAELGVNVAAVNNVSTDFRIQNEQHDRDSRNPHSPFPFPHVIPTGWNGCSNVCSV